MPHVYRTFERPSAKILECLAQFSPATIHEAQGKLGALDSRIKPIAPGLKVYGPALTVQCHIGDNLMLFEAINLAQRGDVLVVGAGNNSEQGGFGDVLAAACIGKGIAGLVIDAGVRDVANLREMGFPVFSIGACMKGTSKDALGTINKPVTVGGQLVRPGDIVSGDDDGVVVVCSDDLQKLANACEARELYEKELSQRYRAGQLDIADRIAAMRLKGCIWSDDHAPRK